MADIYWPEDQLPFALRDGYGISLRDPVEETDFGGAMPPRRRLVDNDSPSVFALGFALSAPRWAYFRGFWAHTLLFGTVPFWIRVRDAGTFELRKVQVIGAPPDFSLLGATGGRASLQVVSLRGTQMDAETYAAMLEYGGVIPYAEFMSAFNIFAEQEMPAPTFKEA